MKVYVLMFNDKDGEPSVIVYEKYPDALKFAHQIMSAEDASSDSDWKQFDENCWQSMQGNTIDIREVKLQ